MQSTLENQDSAASARDLSRESIEKLGEMALNYVLDESYKGRYEYFNDYLQLETEAHHLLPHYYVVLLNREDETRFLASLSIFLRDILFYDAEEPIYFQAVKDRLLKVARLDRAHLVDDIRGLFELYDKLKEISDKTAKQKDLKLESLKTMRALTENHPYAKTWIPRSA